MTPEELELAKKRSKDHADHIKGLRDKAERAANAYPLLQQTQEMADYFYKTIFSMPESTPDSSKFTIVDSLTSNIAFYDNNRDRIDRFDPDILASGLASHTSSSVHTYQSLTGLATAADATVKEWATPLVAEYKTIQRQQDRIASIATTFRQISIDLESILRSAIETHEKALGGLVGKASAGIALRNVLEKFYGEIHSIALNKVRLKKSAQHLKWPEVAAEIAKGGYGSYEYQLLISEEGANRSLKDQLSTVAKNRSIFSNEDMEDMLVELMDHFYTVLNLIDPAYL